MGPNIPYLLFVSAIAIFFGEWLKEYASKTDKATQKILAKGVAKWIETFFLAAIVATLFKYMFGS